MCDQMCASNVSVIGVYADGVANLRNRCLSLVVSRSCSLILIFRLYEI